MRNNKNVTGREYPFPQGKTVISYTNLKGQISHANETFIDLSGFTKEELIGRPHNLVRHPDMPSEAYRDLWDTLKKGRPWSGVVKNRRKDGDHYWVRSYVSPLADGSGYVSVRVAASRQEQSLAAQDIAQRIETIAQGTEQNSMASSKTANSAKQMSELGRKLENLAVRFKIA